MMAMAAMPAGGAAAAVEEVEEQTEFDVVLAEIGDNKINVIKEVRRSPTSASKKPGNWSERSRDCDLGRFKETAARSQGCSGSRRQSAGQISFSRPIARQPALIRVAGCQRKEAPTAVAVGASSAGDRFANRPMRRNVRQRQKSRRSSSVATGRERRP